MIRSLDHNLYFNGSLAYLTLDDDNDLYGPADRTINKAMLGVHGDAETHLLNPGELYYSFELTAGNLTIDDGQAFASFDEQFVETEGSFITLRYRLSHLMHLHGPFSTAVDLTGQVASGNLDTSQKFFIGGPYDVAGYPVSEASGDQGAMIKADLRYDMPEGFLSSDTQLTLFYARASTDIHKDPWAGWEGGNPLIRNRITLKTAGVSSHSTWGGHYMLNLTVGRQVGDNLGRDPATENDSDQSDADYRAWAQFAYFF